MLKVKLGIRGFGEDVFAVPIKLFSRFEFFEVNGPYYDWVEWWIALAR